MLRKRSDRAQLTTLSLKPPYTTKDRTKPYRDKLVKDLIKGYKGNRNWTYRSRHFPEIVLIKGLYYGHKDKGYATEVVTTAKRLPLDNLKDIKDDLGEAQNQQDNNKETKRSRQSQEGF